MTKPSDTQLVLLSNAAQRADGSLLPLPATIAPGGGAAKAIAALLKRGLAEEREVSDASVTRRMEGDVRYGVFMTPAGAAAIGVEPGETPPADVAKIESVSAAVPATPANKPGSKATLVLALLSRDEGATMPELIDATGWLPHTTRAALTGIRKKGHDVVRSKRGGATCYRIASAA